MMPLNFEELIIKVTANTTQAVRELKNLDKSVQATGQSATVSAKKVAALGIAMGGARGAVDLVVKAIGSYIKYIKEAEAAYVTMAKEQGIALSDGVKAYDRLNAALAEQKRLHGEMSLARKAAWRDYRAAGIEERTMVLGLTKVQEDYFLAITNGYGTVYEKAKFAADETARVNAEIATLKRVLESNTPRPAGPAGPATTPAKTTTTTTTAPVIDYATLQYQQRAQSQIDSINSVVAIERQSIIDINDYRMAAQEAELERIEELKRAENELREVRKNNAIDALQNASVFLSAIGTLVNNRYQAEIDAAEEGSDKQKKLMRDQFNAEKAMAITQALIATAVGITKAIPNIPLMIFSAVQGAIQVAAIAATRPPKFATGTPAGGYIVPPGYSDDSYPVMARSGERVTVEPAGGSGGNQTVILQLDGRVLGKAVTNLFDRRQAFVPAGAVVA
jgi:hypothetical protein